MRNFSRSSRRALSTMASMVSSLVRGCVAPWNSSETCSRVRCIAGQMMCEGVSPRELDDVLGQIGLDPLDPGLGQGVRQADLLAQHRLHARDALGPRRAADLDDDPAGLVGGRGPVHLRCRRRSRCARTRSR